MSELSPRALDLIRSRWFAHVNVENYTDADYRRLVDRAVDDVAALLEHIDAVTERGPAQVAPMSGDPFEDPQWLAYAEHAMNDLVPKLRNSAVSVSLVPRGETDIKFALELGMSIMLDKPIIAVVFPGAKVPAHLVRVADAIVEGDMKDPGFRERLMAAINTVLGDKRR